MFNSQIKLLVLRKLSHHDYTGYELMKELGVSLGKKPSPGYMYPLLKDLKLKKFIAESPQGNKHVYTLTSHGKIFLKQLLQRHQQTLHTMMKTFEPLSDARERSQFVRFMHTMQKSSSDENYAYDHELLNTFRTEVMHFFQKSSKHPDKKRQFRALLQKTIQELKKLNRGA